MSFRIRKEGHGGVAVGQSLEMHLICSLGIGLERTGGGSSSFLEQLDLPESSRLRFVYMELTCEEIAEYPIMLGLSGL